MTILSQVYAGSVVSDPIINTLEIRTNPAIYLCDGFEDQAVTTEDGDELTFVASGMNVNLPNRDNTGQQKLEFTIENVTGRAQKEIDEAVNSGQQTIIVYRAYLESDKTAPSEAPLELVVVGANAQGSAIRITCSYQDPINTAWPRVRYTADFAPGLIYYR